MNRRQGNEAALVLVIAAVYFAAAKFGLSMAFVAEQVTLVWPPTGIALAAVLLYGSRVWPGILLGALVANATANEPIGTALGIAAGNTAEAVVGAWLLRRAPGFDVSLSRLADVVRLIVLAAVAATAISASVGAASLCLGGVQPWTAFAAIFRDWWLGDAIGAVVFAPLILVWRDGMRSRPAPRALAEAMALCAGLVVVSGFVYGGIDSQVSTEPLEYLVFPFLIWAALRFGQRGSTAVTLIAATIAIRSTLRGTGPFRASDVHEGLALLQLFIGVVSVTALVLGAAICERNQAGRELKESEARFRFLADTIPSMVWTAASDGTLLYVNRRFVEYCGMSESEIALRWPAAVVHPDDVERRIAEWNAALREGRQYAVEVRKRRRDGEYRWFITRGVPRKDADGRVIAWFGVTTDIHDQKLLQDELREADRLKDEFLATLAHELRSPLAPISNALELLRAAGGDAAVRGDAIDAAERQLRHLVRLVDDLLDVARVSRGRIPLRKERTVLSALVARAIESVGPVIAERGQRLTLRLPDAPVALDADPTRMAQVLANLLHNASKFSEPSAEIRLSADVRSQAGRDVEVAVTVADSGMGIPADLVPHVFDPFVQADHSIERSHGGLGIGLTLVRRLVGLHGGTVECHSEGVGRGSEFVVRLPLPGAVRAAEAPGADGTPAASAPPVAAPVVATDVPRRRVLVADDDRDSAQTMTLLLRTLGHEVRTASDGPGAVAAAAEFEPDVVLLDIGLPGMSGHDVARRIRASVAGGRVTLIAVTGWGQAEDRRRSKEAGFDHHLVKPVDHAELSRLLSDARTRPLHGPAGAAADAPRPSAPRTSNAEFLARMSHDVRTPLGVLVGASRLLDGPDVPPAHRDLVRKVRSGVERLRATLDDYSDLADIEAGKLELEETPLRLAPIVDECVELIASEAADRGVEFACHLDESLPDEIVGDAARLRRVVLNLAWDALGSGVRGEVSLRISSHATSDGRAEIRGVLGDGGQGDVADALDRAFGADLPGAATARRDADAGIGPSVARAICERTGGRMWIERTTGGAAECRFTFLAATRRPLASGATNGSPPAAEGRRASRALVVDDDAFSRTLTRRMLESSGCDVDEADGGAAAISAVARADYDAIVVDLRMAGMDGVRTVGEVRRLPARGPRPVVIATTASTLASDREALLAAGADVCLAKPFGEESLRAALGRAANSAVTREDDGEADAALDPGALAALRSVRGRSGRPVVDELVGLFLDDTPRVIARLRAAAARGDAEDLEDAAHVLRGNCASVGARRLSALASEAEFRARGGDAAGIARIVARIEEAWIVTRTALGDERGG